ncbi:MAG: MFS transporter [Actinomycetota bacterium]|nr:MFS transporter [Actinomycetota bacterium]
MATGASTSSIRSVIAEPVLRVAAGATFVIMLGYGLIVPVLPLFARSFGVGRTEVGVLVSTFALMRLVFDLVGGPLVDRFGGRPVAAGGALVVGISAALSAAAPSFPLLVAFRAIGGAGSSVMFAAVMHHVIRSVPAARMGRSMSVFQASILLGTVMGQPVGGVLAEAFGLASPLVAYAGACFVSAAVLLRYLPSREALREPQAADEVVAETDAPLPSAWGRVRGLLSGRAFVTALFANAVFFWTFGAVRMTLVPLFADEVVGLSASRIGAALGAAGVAHFLVMWKAGALADSRGRKVVLMPGLAGLAAVTAAIGLATSGTLLVLVMAALGVVTGLVGVVPAAVVADVAPRRVSGTAVGMYRFAGDLGLVIGPLTAGVLADVVGFQGAFAATAAPYLAVLLLARGMPETLRRGS